MLRTASEFRTRWKKRPSPLVFMSDRLEQVRACIVAALPRLRRFARAIARDVHDADDLVQLSIERALLKHDQWRPESKFESWMFGVMRNAWIDEVRSRGRRERLFASAEEGENVGHDASAAQVQLLALQRALCSLPEEQRLAVALVLIEGLSYKEAADALEIPIGTLTSRLARGRDALQKML
jgi:RNA polymerase sigma-70 factor, ECF subfamily